MLFICRWGGGGEGGTETSRGIDPAIDSGDGSFLRRRVVTQPGKVSVTVRTAHVQTMRACMQIWDGNWRPLVSRFSV